eukprot:1577386-Amphidinium_carterae.2
MDEALDIRKDDVQVIYAFLDADQDGLVTYTEFVPHLVSSWLPIPLTKLRGQVFPLRGVASSLKKKQLHQNLFCVGATTDSSHQQPTKVLRVTEPEAPLPCENYSNLLLGPPGCY